MNRRQELYERLDVIITACITIVKRLKRNGMRPIVTAQFSNIAMAAESLKKRHDYLLTTVRRKISELEIRLERAILECQDYYGIALQSYSPALLPAISDDGSKAVRVSITLANSDWAYVDSFISAGHVKSYAAFFRYLVNKWLEEKQHGNL